MIAPAMTRFAARSACRSAARWCRQLLSLEQSRKRSAFAT
jgi:hypothetical protein